MERSNLKAIHGAIGFRRRVGAAFAYVGGPLRVGKGIRHFLLLKKVYVF